MIERKDSSVIVKRFSIPKRPLKPEHFIAILKALNKLFPKCFNFHAVNILKIGIFQELEERTSREQFTVNALRRFISQYTNTPEYMKSHYIGAKRIDLDGNIVDEVNAAQYENKLTAHKQYKKMFGVE